MSLDESPESLRVIHLGKVAKLMDHHIINQFRRQEE
jgi:hypothetical protein